MQKWISEYVNGLSSAEYQLQVLLLFLFLLFILYKIYQTYQRYRFISDTPTSKIASAAQGYVELNGLAELMPGPDITSPFSHARCVWYQCIVEKRRRIKSYSSWVQESNELSDHLFHVQDETGVCVVIPDGAYVIPSYETVWFGSNYQEKYRGKFKSGWFNRLLGFGQYRFTEKMISVADPVYISGQFKTRRKKVNEQSRKQQVETLVKRWKKQPLKYLKDFDIDQNGKIQKQEWTLVRQHAANQVQQETVHHTIQKPQERAYPFVISAFSEEQLLANKRNRIMLYSALFFLLLYVLVTAIFSY